MYFTFAQIERAIYRTIQQKIVQMGYLPDVFLYANNPDGYANAKKQIVNQDKKIIEIFGVGDIKARDQQRNNCIYINRGTIIPAAFGAFGVKSFEEVMVNNVKKYNVFLHCSGANNIEYNISYVTDDTDYERIIQSIIFNSLRNKGFLNVFDDSGNKLNYGFNINFRNEIDKSGVDFMEKTKKYLVPFINLEDKIFLYQTSAMDEIDISGDAVNRENINNIL